MEEIIPITCPSCEKTNWVYLGDQSDVTRTSVDACKCWFCSKIFILDDEELFREMNCLEPEDSIEEYLENEGFIEDGHRYRDSHEEKIENFLENEGPQKGQTYRGWILDNIVPGILNLSLHERIKRRDDSLRSIDEDKKTIITKGLKEGSFYLPEKDASMFFDRHMNSILTQICFLKGF